MSRSEKLTLAALALLSLALRALAYFRYRFDSDEPQHLHVAWGWTAGLVQYRDLFDNHTPLFHMLTAPILAAFGERADILLWMRAPMLPLFAVVVGGTYILGRRYASTRVGVWAAVLVSLFPPFFLKSIEYRTDNLWNALWIVALLVLTGGGSAFAVGLILGTALCVSIKTTLLVATIVIAAVIVKKKLNWAALAVGFVIPPAILAAYFVHLKAWDALVYCTFEFNELVTQTLPFVWLGRAAYPFALGAVVWWARKYQKDFLPVAFAVFVVTVICCWILVSPRDFLPMMPIGAVLLAAHVKRGLAPIALVFAASLYYYADRFENRTDEHITMMSQVLGVTRPGEPLMDHKGETIYRSRPYYYIFEAITRAQLAHGLIKDTIPEDMVRANCHASQADGPFIPPRGRKWLSENFLDLGRIRAAGQWLRDDGSFDIAIPGDYVVISENGYARGKLDGQPYIGSVTLPAGPHRFEQEHGERLAVLWAPAFARGYSPFHLRDREF